MSEAEKKEGVVKARAKIYTGEGFDASKQISQRRIRSVNRHGTPSEPTVKTANTLPKEQAVEAKEKVQPVNNQPASQASAVPANKQAVNETAPANKQTVNQVATDANSQSVKQDSADVNNPSATVSANIQSVNQTPAASVNVQTEKKMSPKIKQSSRPATSAQNGPYVKRRIDQLREEEMKKKAQAGLAAANLQKVPEASQRIPNVTMKEKKQLPLFVKILLGVFGGAAVIAYTVIAVYFGFHFYDETKIFGVDCSRKTVEEVKAEVRANLGNYKLAIEERGDQVETISAQQIHLEYDDDGSIDRLLKEQRSYIWPFMLFREKKTGKEVTFSYNKILAQTYVEDLKCMDKETQIEPQDAYIGPTDTGFEVVSEVMGTKLDDEKTIEVVLSALDEGDVDLSLEEEDCYINPTIYQDDDEIQWIAEQKSKLATANITLDFGEFSELIDASVIDNWIIQISNGDFVIDETKVSEYVSSLAERFDTYGLPVYFDTTLGTTVELYGGDYGWELDQGSTMASLMRALDQGYRGTLEPIWSCMGKSHANNGVGYTYVEICISMQEMWCYQDGELMVDTPVVTGNPNRGNATPSGGIWEIDSKDRNAILVGEGYRAPVDYWMPFNGGVGIHDLQSRGWFGGDIYLTNGSHGCVNTPYDAVSQIFDIVSVGTPVIVYD